MTDRFRRSAFVSANAQRVRRARRLAIVAAAIGSGFFAAQGYSSNTLTWDASGTATTTPADGGGTWSTTNVNWNNGSSDSAWNNEGTGTTDSAIFGVGTGAAGAISVATGTVNVNNITFNAGSAGSAYSISNTAGTIVFGDGTTVGASSLNLFTNVTFGSSSAVPTLTIKGTNSLTINGNGNTLILGALGSSLTGGVTLASGTLAFVSTAASSANISALGTGTFTIGAGTALDNVSASNVGGNPVSNNAQIWNGDFQFIGSVHSLNMGTGAVTMNNNVQITVGSATSAGQTFTIGGAISSGANNYGITKAGLGLLVFGGNNTYLGGTTVNAGTLQIQNVAGSATGSGNVTLNGGTLISSGDLAAISGSVLAGSGAHTIVPGNTGTIATLTLGGLTTNSNTTLNFDLTAPGAAGDQIITGAGGLTIGAGTKFTFGINPADTGNYRLISYTGSASVSTAVTLPTPTSSRTHFAFSGTVDPGFADLVVTNDANVNAHWLGTVASNWTTAGKWDTVTPGIPGDTVTFGATAGATAQTVTLVNAQHVGILNFSNTTTPTPGGYTLAAAGSLWMDTGTSAQAFLNNNNGSNTITAPVTLNSNTTITTLAGTQLTLSGAINSTFSQSITLPAANAGTLTINTAANSYTGGTIIQGGTVIVDNNASLGTGPVTIGTVGTPAINVITLQSATALRALANALVLNNDFTMGGTAATNNLTFTGPVTLGATPNITIGNAAVTTIFSNTIGSSPFGITKSGPGSLSLTGVNLYTGVTTLNSGTLTINSEGLPGAGGSLGLNPVNPTPGLLVLNGGNLSAGTVTLGSNRGVTLGAGGASITATGAATNFEIDGIIAGSGALTVNSGAGVYVPRGANTYTGGTTLASGSNTVPQVSSLGPDGSPTSGPFGTGTLTLAGGTLRATSSVDVTIKNAITLSGDTTFPVAAAAPNLILTGPTTLSGGTRTLTVLSTFPGTVAFNGAIGDGGNTLGLTKAGAGILVLGSANTYAGPTTLSAGTLVVANGDRIATGSGDVTLNGGVLASNTSGRISGNVLAGSAAHTIAPGGVGNVGTLTIGGNLTTNSSVVTTLNFDVGTPGSNNGDVLNVGGTFTPSANTVVSVSPSPTIGGLYRLIGLPSTAAVTSAGAALAVPASPSSRVTYVWDTTSDPNFLDLSVTGGTAVTANNWTNTTTAAAQTWASTGNWSAGVIPAISGDFANLNSAIAAAQTIQLFGQQHVASLTFNSAGAGAFTIAQNSATDSLVFDNVANGAAATLANTAKNNVISAPIVLASSTNVTVATATTLTLSGIISAPGAQTLNVSGTGTGTLVLSGANTFTGGTAISIGAVKLGSASALGGGGTTVGSAANSTATLDLAGFSVSTPLVLNGVGVSSGGALDNSSTTASTVTAPVTLNTTTSIGGLNGGASGAGGIVLGGVVSGNGGLNKVGAGNVVLNSANTYSGPTTLNGGALIAANANALANTSSITIQAGTSYLGLQGNITISGKTISILGSGNNDGALQSISGNNVWAGPVTIAANGTRVGAQAGNLNIAGVISGPTGFDLVTRTNPPSTVTFSGANNYLGNTNIGIGTAFLGLTNSLPDTILEIGITTNLGAFDLNGFNQRVASLTIAAAVTLTGQIVTNSSTTPSTLTLDGNAAGAYTNLGSITGNLSLVKLGTGSFTLAAPVTGGTGVNTYTGSTTVGNGTFVLGASGALPATTTVNFGNAAPSSGILDLAGFTQTVAGLTVVGGTANQVINSSGTAGALTVNIAAATSNTFSGSLGSGATNNFSLTKSGAGTLILSGTNNYTGTTTVSAGVLGVTGTATGQGSYTVAASATLSGAGSIALAPAASNQIIVNGTIAAGNYTGNVLTPGVLSITNASPGAGSGATLLLNSGGTLAAAVTNTTTFSQFNVTGTVNVTGATLNFTLPVGYVVANTVSGDTYPILLNDGSDAITGQFATLANATLVSQSASSEVFSDANYTYTLTYNANADGGPVGNDLTVNVQAVPEPGAMAVFAIAAAGLLSRRRRRLAI